MIKRVNLNTATNCYTVFLENGERYTVPIHKAKDEVVEFCLNASRVMESGVHFIYVND